MWSIRGLLCVALLRFGRLVFRRYLIHLPGDRRFVGACSLWNDVALEEREKELLRTHSRLTGFDAVTVFPIVRLQRILFDLGRTGQLSRLMPRILPVAALALMADAFGELFGYLFGGGQAMCALTEMEFHRHRFMNRADLDAGRVNQHGVAAVE